LLTLQPARLNPGGRPKGRANGVNSDIRGMMHQALHRVGGVKYLAQQAIDHPGAFLTLLAKVMPAHIVSESSNHLHLHLEAAMEVSKQMLQQPKRAITIEPQAQDAPSGSLIDAPLPEE
jgi:hypothetical protein